MPRSTAALARAPSPTPFRPALDYARRDCAHGAAELEVRKLKAELARVRSELREMTLATQQFVRSML